jgi:hypothetical protein
VTTLAIEAAILGANAEFYRSFTRGDFMAMSALWAKQWPISCLHPGTPALFGRGPVLEAWRHMLREPLPFEMRCHHPRVQLIGQVALVLAYEGNDEQPAHLAVTNAFALEDGEWRMVHHQAGPLSRPVAVKAGSASN